MSVMLTWIIFNFIKNNVLLFKARHNLTRFKLQTSLVYKTRFVIDTELTREMEIAGCIHRRNWKGSRARWSVEGISSLLLFLPLDTFSIPCEIRKPEVRSSPFRRAPSPKAIVTNWMTLCRISPWES